MNDNRVKVLCARCSRSFRERISCLHDGYQTQCPNCYRMMTFTSDSEDASIRRAMKEARRIRNGVVIEPSEFT
jgi:hypothetical protein